MPWWAWLTVVKSAQNWDHPAPSPRGAELGSRGAVPLPPSPEHHYQWSCLGSYLDRNWLWDWSQVWLCFDSCCCSAAVPCPHFSDVSLLFSCVWSAACPHLGFKGEWSPGGGAIARPLEDAELGVRNALCDQDSWGLTLPLPLTSSRCLIYLSFNFFNLTRN